MSEILRDQERFAEARIITQILQQVSEHLRYIHENLNPQKVLIDEDHMVKAKTLSVLPVNILSNIIFAIIHDQIQVRHAIDLFVHVLNTFLPKKGYRLGQREYEKGYIKALEKGVKEMMRRVEKEYGETSGFTLFKKHLPNEKLPKWLQNQNQN